MSVPNIKSDSPPLRIYLIFLSIIIIWGLTWPLNKLALQYTSPLWFSALRLLVGTVFIFITLGVTGQLRLPNREDVGPIVIIGLFQIAIFMACVNLGLQYVAAGRSAIIVYSTPIWVAPVAVVFFKEVLTPVKWLGLFFGFAGICLLFSPWEFIWTKNAVIGNSILLMAALCWAFSIMYNRFVHWHSPPLALIPWQLLVATLVTVPIAYFADPTMSVNWSSWFIANLTYSGLLATAFGYWGVIEVSKALPAVTTSLVLLAIPVIGLVASTLILHEPLSGATVLALGLILSGVACLAFGRKAT